MAKKQSKKKRREPTLAESIEKVRKADACVGCTRKQFFSLLSRFVGAKVEDPG